MSRDIPINLIDRDEAQPRQHFDAAALDELAQSIAANGLAVPILVRPVGERYVIVHGERRYRAVCSLQWKTIPTDVRDVSEDEAHWLALVENVQRADLSPIEEARAYQARLAEGLTQEELGRRIGKTQSYIAQKLRLLKLPAPVVVLLDRKAITEGHARQLLRLEAMYHGMTETYNNRIWPAFTVAHVGATAGFLTDEEIQEPGDAVFLFYNAFRVEDYPLGIKPKDDKDLDLLIDASCAFAFFVHDSGYTIPLWTRAAFWWASLATHMPLGVARLAKMIDLWHDRFLSCVGWYLIRPEEPLRCRTTNLGPHQTVDLLLYWGGNSDLRHGGIEAYMRRHGELPRDLTWEALEYMGKNDGATALPSVLQPWGCKETSDKYTAALDKIVQYD